MKLSNLSKLFIAALSVTSGSVMTAWYILANTLPRLIDHQFQYDPKRDSLDLIQGLKDGFSQLIWDTTSQLYCRTNKHTGNYAASILLLKKVQETYELISKFYLSYEQHVELRDHLVSELEKKIIKPLEDFAEKNNNPKQLIRVYLEFANFIYNISSNYHNQQDHPNLSKLNEYTKKINQCFKNQIRNNPRIDKEFKNQIKSEIVSLNQNANTMNAEGLMRTVGQIAFYEIQAFFRRIAQQTAQQTAQQNQTQKVTLPGGFLSLPS